MLDLSAMWAASISAAFSMRSSCLMKKSLGWGSAPLCAHCSQRERIDGPNELFEEGVAAAEAAIDAGAQGPVNAQKDPETFKQFQARMRRNAARTFNQMKAVYRFCILIMVSLVTSRLMNADLEFTGNGLL